MTCAKKVSISLCCSWHVMPHFFSIQDTLKLVKQLAASGASLIAVHARYRGTPTHRRDGPAHLDQVGGWWEREDRMVSSKKGWNGKETSRWNVWLLQKRVTVIAVNHGTWKKGGSRWEQYEWEVRKESTETGDIKPYWKCSLATVFRGCFVYSRCPNDFSWNQFENIIQWFKRPSPSNITNDKGAIIDQLIAFPMVLGHYISRQQSPSVQYFPSLVVCLDSIRWRLLRRWWMCQCLRMATSKAGKM